MQYITAYLEALIELTNEMAPYLLLGFLIAGILHVYFPKDKVNRYLGQRNLGSVLNATLFGIPLPLCSCGVIPTGVSMFRNGAAKGPTVSFLISTPQTGVDSILATYSLLGWPLAIIRPLVALVTGVAGGLITNKTDKETVPAQEAGATEQAGAACTDGSCCEVPAQASEKPAIVRMMRYAFVDFMQDIAQWLLIGLAVAALIAVLVPDGFFERNVGNEYLGLVLVLVAAIPLYVCATGSVPIAAVLLMKGISPGAALVFLMAGPATNAATITVIGKTLGRKSLFAYLGTIIVGALLSGVLINEFVPREWIMGPVQHHVEGHGPHLIPHWLSVGSSILLVLLIANAYWQKYRTSQKMNLAATPASGTSAPINGETQPDYPSSNLISDMDKVLIKVNGMTCNHCKASVERNLKALEGIDNTQVDLATAKVLVEGKNIDLEKIKAKVEEIGYEYEGQVEEQV